MEDAFFDGLIQLGIVHSRLFGSFVRFFFDNIRVELASGGFELGNDAHIVLAAALVNADFLN